MPRQQTNQLGTIGLNPVAQPVNQFVRPEVRYKDHAGDLLQLAQALSTIKPEINDTLSRLGQTTERNMRQQARVDAASLSLKNKQDFQNAVSNGLLKEQDNPWYHAQMEQEIAGAEARSYIQKLQVDYTQNGLMYSKNPQQIDQWVQDATVEMLKGRSGAEAEAVIQEMEPFRQRMVQGHIEFQAKLTDRDRQASVLTGLSGILKKYEDADYQNPQTLSDIQKQISDFRAERSLTLDEDTVDTLIYKALESESENRTTNVARSVLSGIKRRDGVSLADVKLNRVNLEQLDLRVGQLSLQRGQMEEQADQQAQQRALVDVLGRAKSKAAQQGVPLQNVVFTDDEIKHMDFRVYERFLQYQVQVQNHLESQDNSSKKNARDDATRKLYGEKIGGFLTSQNRNSYLAILAANDGAAAIENYLQMEEHIDRDQWGITSPDTEVDLVEKFSRGELTLALLSQLAHDMKIDRSTFEKWQSRIVERGGSWTSSAKSNQALAEYGQMAHEFLSVQANDVSDALMTPEQRKADVQSKFVLADLLLSEGVQKLEADPSFNAASTSDRRKRLDELFNSVMSNQAIGGYTIDSYKQAMAGRAQKAKEDQQAQQAAAEAARVAAEAKYEKEHPESQKFLPPNTFNSPVVPSLSDDQKTALRRAIGTGSTFKTPDGRTVYGISDYDPKYLWTKSNLLVSPVQDLYKAWLSQQGPTYTASYRANAGKELPALQKVTENRKALEAQLERQGARSKFEGVMAALQTRDQQSKTGGQWFVLPQEKRTIYEFIDNARTLSLLRSMSTYDLEEVQKMGKGFEMNVPMFYTEADLNSPKLQEIANKLGRKSLEQQAEFYAAQLNLLVQRRRQLLNY